MAHSPSVCPRLLQLALLSLLLPSASLAVEPPKGGSPAVTLAFEHPDSYINENVLAPASLPPAIASRVRMELAVFGLPEGLGYYDLRADRWGTLMTSRPMIPGSGIGNVLVWPGLPEGSQPGDDEIGRAALAAFRAFVVNYRAQLRVDPAELTDEPRVTVHEHGRLVRINIGRTFLGVPVRGSEVSGVLNSGNLVLYGTTRWGDVDVSALPDVSRQQARDAIAAYAARVPLKASLTDPELILVPFENGDDPARVVPGRGYRYQLAWSARVNFADDPGDWEALLDAHSGKMLGFADQNHYVERQIRGGVYPLTNDKQPPDGVEQAGWPMPFANANTARTVFTNSNGLVFDFAGTMTTTLDGQYVRISDNCGAISQSAASGDLDLGASDGTDCTRPPGSGASGTTHAARTGFYELNRIKEQWRSWLPANTWVSARLTSNMNINNTCNAFWTGSGTSGTVNFYREGGGCANTGEIAGVFDHEAGHGFDANDARSGTSNSSEAYADIVSMLRLNKSCIGRGFRLNNVQCGGNGDPCLDCSGVRQEDWTKRLSGLPHNIDWIRQDATNPGAKDSNGNWTRWPGGCNNDGRTGGPCGNGTHCNGSVSAEAWWDLMHRELAGQNGSSFNWDENTRLNYAARLGLLGMNNVGTWFSCATDGFGGCGSTSAYLNFLTVDDDNGNLSDGTPHMTAIYAAHNRHQLACATPTPQNSGCATRPTQAPQVTITRGTNSATITWTEVPGATRYWLFKADGVNGCVGGKEKLVDANVTTFTDTTLVNGREFFYTVMAVGASNSCFGPASECASIIPGAVPVASDVSAATDEDTAVTVTLSATDDDSGSLTLAIVSNPTSGSLGGMSPVTCAPKGGSGSTCTATVTYTPTANANGSDSFTYRASDGTFNSAPATVSITVRAVNDPPSASDTAAVTTEDSAVQIALHGSDVDDGSLTFAVSSPPAHGTVAIGAVSCTQAGAGATCTADARYTPASDYYGPDSFTYRTHDGKLDSGTATVGITVTPVNDPPVSRDAAASTEMGTPVDVTLQASDVDHSSLSFMIVALPSHGSLGTPGTPVCSSAGAGAACTATVTYSPVAGYSGPDSFTFRASDGQADSNTSAVSLAVTRGGKITGGGYIVEPGGEPANFGFTVQRDSEGRVSGNLQYHNHGRDLTVTSTTISTVVISGNRGTFTGACTKNGSACTFRVTATDVSEPGFGDRFVIEVSGEPAEGESAPIAGGNIQVHKQ